jgi:NAD(P)-dependent dehydrogenase (short-subunit alcohol dehydrogenase family)
VRFDAPAGVFGATAYKAPMSIYGRFAPRGASGFGYASTAAEVTEGLSLAGRTVLVTGCSSGIGQEAMRVLALRGARVVGTARTLEKAEHACAGMSGATLPLACELAEPASIAGCIEALKQAHVRLDAIICNAGVMAFPELQRAHGYELQFLTNHIGHFMLVTGLLDQLADRGRVVVLSSAAHRQAPQGGIQFDNLDGSKGYRPWTAYGQSKFANLLFAKELARRFEGSEKTANAVHPGVIRTNLQRHMNPVLSVLFGAFGPLALKTVAEGAATEVYVATRPELAGVSGKYFADCNLARPRPDAEDPALARRLWETSEQIVAKLRQG